MSIPDRDRKILWARSGNRCAICRIILINERNQKDKDSVIGDECHIKGQKKGASRYFPDKEENTIDSYENLILLCKVHHKVIDDQINTYTEEYLLEIKSAHEKWVNDTLNFSKKSLNPLKINKSFINGGLKNLIRIDIVVDFSTKVINGNYQIVINYSGLEENRLSYLFTGNIIANHLMFVDFDDQILPYETDPSLKSFGSNQDVWRLNELSDGSQNISINTYGKNYETGFCGEYIMTMEEYRNSTPRGDMQQS